MKSLLANPGVLFRLQKTLLPSYGILFVAAVYILFWEIAYRINWSATALGLLLILVASLLLPYMWARIEYAKVQLLLNSLQSNAQQKETSLQHNLRQLSFKEKDVLQHILAGKSNKDICASLFIEQSTLKSHINHIYKKLGVNSRKEIILVLK